ncbi:MAG: hypothetical protein MJE66_09715, partial [Proteobacteria bacterium]|nr:hypothetical protein [Pseudomonadota bacterium]
MLDRATLRQFVQHSASVVVAEFESGPVLWRAPDGSDHQDVFRCRRLELLAGDDPGERFAFFPHAEGFPAFAAGDRALVFLESTAERPEFAALAPFLPLYSLQERGEEWKLAGASGDATLMLARDYARWLQRTGGRESNAGVHRLAALLLKGLRTGATVLEDDALAELLRLRNAPRGAWNAPTLAAFTRFAKDPGAPFRLRLGVVRALETREGFAAAPAWAALLATAETPADRIALARAARHDAPAPVAGWLRAQLTAAGEPDLRRE